jgi:hypothetical protein
MSKNESDNEIDNKHIYPYNLFINLLKEGKITHIFSQETDFKLNNCYVLGLTPNNKTHNIQRILFNKIAGLYIYIFDENMIYHYDQICYDEEKIKDLINIAENFIDKNNFDVVNGNFFFCFNQARSFGHCICNILSILNENKKNKEIGLLPISGFTTNHIYQIIRIFYPNLKILAKTNQFYKIDEITIYKNIDKIWPFQIDQRISKDIRKKVYKKRKSKIKFIPCFLKFKTHETTSTLGPSFKKTPKLLKFFENNKIKCFFPEKMHFYQLLNIIYNCKTIIVQWGALSFLPFIFASFLNIKVIVLKHESYNKELWTHPENYIITKDLPTNLNGEIPYLRQLFF